MIVMTTVMTVMKIVSPTMIIDNDDTRDNSRTQSHKDSKNSEVPLSDEEVEVSNETRNLEENEEADCENEDHNNDEASS